MIIASGRCCEGDAAGAELDGPEWSSSSLACLTDSATSSLTLGCGSCREVSNTSANRFCSALVSIGRFSPCLSFAPPSPSNVSSAVSLILLSHGSRSLSLSGWPEAILATLAGGWRSSPSMKGMPSAEEREAPRVDLPLPDVPWRRRGGADRSACLDARRSE